MSSGHDKNCRGKWESPNQFVCECGSESMADCLQSGRARSYYAVSHEAPRACPKCGKTPPFPGGTRCQSLSCPLIRWDGKSFVMVEPSAPSSEVLPAPIGHASNPLPPSSIAPTHHGLMTRFYDAWLTADVAEMNLIHEQVVNGGWQPSATALSKWIPVTERLPEGSLTGVIALHREGPWFTYWIAYYFADRKEWQCALKAHPKKLDVTHWMPLPEYPANVQAATDDHINSVRRADGKAKP